MGKLLRGSWVWALSWIHKPKLRGQKIHVFECCVTRRLLSCHHSQWALQIDALLYLGLVVLICLTH